MDHLTITPPGENGLAALHQQIHALEQRLLERDQFIAELRAQERKLRALLDLSYDWVWEVDAQAVYTFVGSRVQDFWATSRLRCWGRRPLILCHLTRPSALQRFSAP
jgi:PAS domain-containing protein